MFLLREVRPADIEDLESLAARLNTLNLPANRDYLEKLIAKSRIGFGEKPLGETAEYVFVLRDLDLDKVIGTCMIIAQHGTFERPAVYFQTREEQRYAPSIKRHFKHRVLQLAFDYSGPTEIGGLILHPEYRGHKLKLGKLLAFVRFLYIGMHTERFRDEIVAELLPPLREDGTSALWDALGKHFTGLDYMSADKLSREDVDFIRRLFPNSPIYTSLLPDHVQELIGTVGEPTLPVEKMLERIGFAWDGSIDPFDGGPTFRVRTRDCEATRRVQWETFAGKYEGNDPDGWAMIGFEYEGKSVRFRSTYGPYKRTDDGIEFFSEGMDILRMNPGDQFGFLPFSGPGLFDL